MKSNIFKVISSTMCVLVLCTFKIIPTVSLSHDEAHNIDISYRNAQISNGKLTISMNYNSGGEPFEIGRDIIVAADSDFEDVLRITNRVSSDNGNYTYELDSSNISNLKTVYIKPPILYMPTEIAPISISLATGEVAKVISENEDRLGSVGEDLFSVDSINIEESSDDIYIVRVIVDAISKDLPRLPKLVNGNNQIGGVSVLHFDENDDFKYGEFLFHINASSEDEAEMIAGESSLVISDILMRVDAGTSSMSSNIKSLDVVTVEE